MLQCVVVQEDPEIFKRNVRTQVEDICTVLQSNCRITTDNETLARYSNFSTLLGCKDFGHSCSSDSDERNVVQSCADVSTLVDAINELEESGGFVPRALKRSLATYVEICATTKDISSAIADVRASLSEFYANHYIGCEEAEAERGIDSFECRAAIDAKWQYFAVRSTLDLSDRNSVVSATIRAAIKRWTGME
jgi:hypothetical protein